jgi:ribosomal protein L24E
MKNDVIKEDLHMFAVRYKINPRKQMWTERADIVSEERLS